MNEPVTPPMPDDDAGSPQQSVSERNVAQLIERAYRPQPVDPAFASRVLTEMKAAARAVAQGASGRSTFQPSSRTANLLAFAASLLLVVGLGWQMIGDLFSTRSASPRQVTLETGAPSGQPSDEPGYLAPQPRPHTAPAAALALGAAIETKAGERRRVVLPDHTVVYIDEQTALHQVASRQLAVSRGAVYLEVAPAVLAAQREAGVSTAAPFIVTTPHRRITATDERFAVRITPAAGVGQPVASVLVTQGRVNIAGRAAPIDAGHEWISTAAGDEVRPAARAAHSLHWTRELMTAADAALVPASKFAGGALVVTSEDGREQRLSLERYHVDVHIEDGFARTTIDQTFFNHEHQRSEGTFIFPLPADASISRLAMYVGRQLMEGGMVERERARNIFEEIRYARKDPALLEWIDGTTFKMRVFPIEPREHKRIILCYTQKLDTAYQRTTYRFPAGHSFEGVGQWSFHARIRGADKLTHHCPTHALTAFPTGGDLLLTASAANARLDRDLVLMLNQNEPAPEARVATDINEGHRYVMLRFRPDLPREAKAQVRRHWVFLLETSADRNPLLARAQIEIMRAMLENAGRDDTFALVTAGTHAKTWADAARTVTAEHVQSAVAFAEKSHLVGALDLEKALTAAIAACGFARPPAAPPAADAPVTTMLVHLGSATAAIGTRDTQALIDLLPADAAYIGVQVGNRGTRAFMQGAAAKTGGYVTQINPDEPLAWRGFELISALSGPRLLDVKVTAIPTPAGQSGFLLISDAAVHGQEICAIARLDAKSPPPSRFTITGRLDGQPFEKAVEVKEITHHAGYLARVWGRLEIDRLVAQPPAPGAPGPAGDEQAAAHRERIVKLSQGMHVMSPYTSLLVLENDAMYQQYKVQRTQRVEWAPYPAPTILDEKPAARVTPELTPGVTPGVTPGTATDAKQPADTDAFAHARKLLVAEKIAEGGQAETQGAFRIAAKHYGDALAIDPTSTEAKAGLASAQAKIDAGHTPVDPSQTIVGEMEVVRQATITEYNELMARATALREARNLAMALEAVQVAKVVLDRNRSMMGTAVYEQLRSRADALYNDVSRQALESSAVERAEIERRDAGDASTRTLTAERERHQAVQRLLHRANDLRKTQEYDRSLQVIQQALFLDPTNPAAEAMKMMIEDGQIAAKSREYVRMRNLRAAGERLYPGHLVETFGNRPRIITGRASRFDEQEEALWPGLNRRNRGPSAAQHTRVRNLRFARHQMEMIEATIPYNELITSPSDWPQLTASRLGALEDRGESEINRRVAQKLQDTLPINFEGNKLVNVIDYFRNTTGVNFFVNWAALEAAGAEQDLPITLQLSNVSAEQALRLVLQQANGVSTLNPIGFAIIDGIVHISTRSDLQQTTDTRVYDIRELLVYDPKTRSHLDLDLRQALSNTAAGSADRSANRAAPAADAVNEGEDARPTRQELIDHISTLIMDTVGLAGDWTARGGELSSIRELNGNLIIKTTPDNHRQIIRLLSQLRLAKGQSLADVHSFNAAALRDYAREAARPPTGAADDADRLALALAAAQHYLAVERIADAEAALRPHLSKQMAMAVNEIDVELFRVAAVIFAAHGEPDLAVAMLERALDAEYAVADEIELELFREDYVWLLGAYADLAANMERIDPSAVDPLAARIIRAADRWRAIDPEPDLVCALAGKALRGLGRRDLAWAYETTPLAHQPHSVESALQLARAMAVREEFDAADRFYIIAFELEPTNPNWLWERAMMLRAAGRRDEARRLLEQIVQDRWQTRFDGIIAQAKAALTQR